MGRAGALGLLGLSGRFVPEGAGARYEEAAIAKKRKHGKKGKKHREKPASTAKAPDASVADEDPRDDEARVRAYARLMGVEQRLYEIWEERSGGQMDWIGEVMRDLVDEDVNLWIAAIGDNVAALGGHVELVAVFPDETVTLLDEPGLTPARATHPTGTTMMRSELAQRRFV